MGSDAQFPLRREHSEITSWTVDPQDVRGVARPSTT